MSSFGMPYGRKRIDENGKQHSIDTINGERYVYYKRLNTDFAPGSEARARGEAIYNKAMEVFNNRIEYGGNPQNISIYFGHLAEYEFSKEKDLLETYFKTSYNPNSPLCGKNLIEAFNLILSTKEIFQRNALLLANTNQKGVFSFFPHYLNKALEEWIGKEDVLKNIEAFTLDKKNKGRSNTEKIRKAVEKNINEHIDDIVQLALEKMFSEKTDIEGGLKNKGLSKEEKDKLQKAYKEIYDAIKNVNNKAKTNEFVRGIAQNYKLFDNLGEMVSNNLKNKKLNMGNLKSAVSGFKFKISAKQAGSLAGIDAEFFGNFLSSVTLSNKGVSFDNIHTGGGLSVNQKADMMITIGMNPGAEAALREKLNNFSGTGRGSNVGDVNKLIEEMFRDFGNNNSFMLMINSKNYTPNWNFRNGYITEGGNKIGGYSAGSAINLNTWDDMMHQLNIRGRDMIFTIMQLIPGAIGGEKENREKVSDMFARAIGSALFDDFEPEDPIEKNKKGPKVVHLLYLNGIYVPLSVFYTLLSEAFNNLQNDLDRKELVEVEFNLPHGILYPRQRDQRGVEHPWGVQSNAALDSITVSYHFLKGFQKFLQQFYQINNNKTP